MGVPIAAERRLLTEDEYDPVAASHYPALEAAKREDLIELARWLRARRAKASDIVRHRRRVRRGKQDPRNIAAETASERGLAAKKQVFSRALRRVNARIDKIRTDERRAEAIAHMHEALARKAAKPKRHPKAGAHATEGMAARPSTKREKVREPSETGRVSQAGKRAQAKKDARSA
jgi:hypothetical protein